MRARVDRLKTHNITAPDPHRGPARSTGRADMVTPGATERVRQVVGPVVDGADLYLEDVVVSPAGRQSVVRIIVDLPEDVTGGLDLDRLAEVSRAVSAALDGTDAIGGAYTLEVSTPGTGRPLTEV